MMKKNNDLFRDVSRFSAKFGLVPVDFKSTKNRQHNKILRFKLTHVQEELDEVYKAERSDDRVQLLDGLVDLIYVALGTCYILGLPFQSAWDLVHRANMKKVRATRASQSKRGSTLDIVKPPGWQAPDLGILFESRSRSHCRSRGV